MYSRNLYHNSFYQKLISAIYASTQIAILYIGMYYNVTLGLPLTYIAAITVIVFFYDNYIKSAFSGIISKNQIIFKNNFYLIIFIILLFVSIIILFSADKFINKEALLYYYFFAVIIYETFFTLLNVYSDYFHDKSNLDTDIKKRYSFTGLALSAVAFPVIHYFADFTATAAIYASAGFIVLVCIIIKYRKINFKNINYAVDNAVRQNDIKYLFSCKEYISSYLKYLLLESAWLILICSFPVYTKFSLNSAFVPVALFQFCILIPALIIKYFYADKVETNNKIYIFGLLMCIAGSVLYFFSSGILITALASLFFGLGYAIASSIHENNLSSSIMEYKQTDERKFVSLKYFNERLASLSSVLKALSLCSLTFIFGYYSGINHGLQASAAWRFAYGIIPIAFILIIFVLNIFFKIKNPSK